MTLGKAGINAEGRERGARARSSLADAGGDRLARAGLLSWAMLVFLLACREVSGNPDLPWHLEFGRRILDGRGVPAVDTLTYTAAGRPYIDLHWLWQAACAWIHGWGGIAVLVLANALAITLALLLPLVVGARRRTVGWIAPWAALLILLGMEIRFAVRPEVASLLYLSAGLSILWFTSWPRPWTLWLLVPLQILWTNTQPLFVIGIIVAGLSAAGDALEARIGRRRAGRLLRRRERILAAVLPAMLVGTLANPFGPRGALFPLQLLDRVSGSSTVFREAISELLPTFHRAAEAPATAIPMAVALATACLGWVLRARRRHWLRGGLLLAPFLYLALSSVRNVPYVLLIGIFVWVESARSAPRQRRYPPLMRRGAGIVFLATTLILSAGALTGLYYEAMGRTVRTGLRLSRLSHPGSSVMRHAAMLPAGVRVFNGLDTAGFLASVPGREGTLFIDGRLEVMGEDVFRAYSEAMSSRTAFETTRDRYGFRAAFLSTRLATGTRMAAALVESGGWIPAAVSASTILLIGASLAEDLRWEPARPEDLLEEMNGEKDPTVLRQAGRAAMCVGWVQVAVLLLDRSLDLHPADSGTTISLVEALLRAGRDEEARRIALEGTRRFPRSYGMQEALAQVLLLQGDEGSIGLQLATMRERFSDEPRFWGFLARYYAQTGRPQDAEQARSRARELSN